MMSEGSRMKIHVSYDSEEEAKTIKELLKPILDRFKIKENTGTPPYKHLYFIPRKGTKSQE